MPDRDAVLFANEAFYRAFADRDVAAMGAVWADGGAIACIHPGWGPLTGRAAVMESWRRILTGGQAPRIACRAPRAFVLGEAAYVICYEEIEGAVLVATNLFRREGRTWKLVHHQAGPCGQPPPDDEDEPEAAAPRAN